MNGLPYYKAYPRDFVEGTVGMPLELKGAYRVLIDLIYLQGGRLPDDAHYISGLLGCSVRKWRSLRKQLVEIGKIKAENGIISQKRADKELEILSKYQETQSENRRGYRKNKDLEEPRSNHTEPEPEKEERANALSKKKPPEPSPFEILTDVVSPEVASDFLDHRKAMTPRAAKLIAKKIRDHPDPDAGFERKHRQRMAGRFPRALPPATQTNQRRPKCRTPQQIPTQARCICQRSVKNVVSGSGGRALTLLSHYYREDDPIELTGAMGKDWADVLEGIPAEYIQRACIQYERDEPRRRPTPGDIYQRRGAMIPPPTVVAEAPAPQRDPRVSREDAARILARHNFNPRRFK